MVRTIEDIEMLLIAQKRKYYLFNKHFCNPYYAPGTVLSA